MNSMQWLIERWSGSVTRRWGDKENIETGPCGIILLLMEYYKQRGDNDCLMLADKLLQETVTYCRQYPTANYALYTGRGGVVYTLLQRARLGAAPQGGSGGWTAVALELIAPANRDFLHSTYVTDDLYSGRAGTLLLLLHLYLETRQPFLRTYIEQFTACILERAQGGPEGMYWQSADAVYIRPSVGMAFGASGIQYVFAQLARATGNKACAFISAEAARYVQTAWIPEYNNWGNFSRRITTNEAWQQCLDEYKTRGSQLFDGVNDHGWAEGMAGILLAGAGGAKAPEWPAEVLLEAGRSYPGTDANWSLYDGITGMALCILEKDLFPDEKSLAIIAGGVSRRMADIQSCDGPEGGLLHGDPGCLYFLLRYEGRSRTPDHILAPFRCVFPDAPVMDDLPGITMPAIRNVMLSRQYPRTVSFLQSRSPLAWKKYMNDTNECDHHRTIASFRRLVTEKSFLKGGPAVQACLSDVYQLEEATCQWRAREKRSPLQQYLDDWQRQTAILEQLGHPDEWLLEQTLCLSSGITLLSSAWDWSFADDFGGVDDGMQQNIHQQAGRFEYLLQVDGRGGVTVSLLKYDTLLLRDYFAKPLLVSDAIKCIQQYLHSLPGDELRQLLASVSEFTDTEDYFRQLESTVLYAIRQWLYRGILQFHI